MACGDFLKNATERVLIEKQTLVTDDYGGQSNTWATVGTYWAWVRPLTSYEKAQAMQLQSACTHKIIIRYQSGLADTKVTGAYRLTLDSRVHNIKGVKNLDADMTRYGKAYQELLTEENAAEVA